MEKYIDTIISKYNNFERKKNSIKQKFFLIKYRISRKKRKRKNKQKKKKKNLNK